MNEKYGEFLLAIYKHFKEKYDEEMAREICGKCKIIPSSEIAINFIKKTLNILGLDEYNIMDENYITDVDGNGKYDVKDFLNLENSEIIDMNNKKKFDICLMNPPYDGDLHLQFLEKSLGFSDKIVCVEPATWLINIRTNGKAKIYNRIKQKIENHVNDLLIENYNNEFSTGLYTPFNIITIDFTKEYNNFNYECCGNSKMVKSIYDCNLIGEYNLIWDILNKINCDKVKNHLYDPNKKYSTDIWYCKYSGILGRGICADPRESDVWYRNGLYCSTYLWPAFDDRVPNHIQPNPIKSLKSGYTYDHPVYTDNVGNNIVGTKKELENYYYNCYNTLLIPFINICMTIDQNNNSMDYIPWLVDKQYTDDEIFKKFNFSNDEISLIKNTINKFKKNNIWFKRYMYGPTNYLKHIEK